MMDFHHFSGRTLVISPHFDDACYSVGGLLLKKTSKEVVNLTIFSRSRCAPKLELIKPFSKAADALNINSLKQIVAEYVSKQRRYEDRRFCDRLNVVQEVFSFDDVSLRAPETEYSFDAENIVEEPVYDDVLKALTKIIFSGFDSILCPLAVGNQVDHLIVMKAFLQTLRENNDVQAELFFYEDLPYACNYDLNFISSLASKRGGACDPLIINITAELRSKLELVAVYRSQFTTECNEQISHHARRLFIHETDKADAAECYERFWKIVA